MSYNRAPQFSLTYCNPNDTVKSVAEIPYKNFLNNINDSVQYTANKVGTMIEEANAEQITAIKEGFYFIDQTLTLIQQGLINTNILLENIGGLLKLPDSEKQRQLHIERGLKFVNQSFKDDEIAFDAENEFNKALKLMPQDWFVLQQLGMLLLYNQKVLNIEVAKNHFLKAAKYANADSISDENSLINNLFKQNLNLPLEWNDLNDGLEDFVKEAFLNAAFAAYISCEFEEAATIAKKALSIDPANSKTLLLTAKYLSRNNQKDEALEYFKNAINNAPYLSTVFYGDDDLLSIQGASEFCGKYLDDYFKNFKLVIDKLFEVKDFIGNPFLIELNKDYNYENDIMKSWVILHHPLEHALGNDTEDHYCKFDALFEDSAGLIVSVGYGSTSKLQRHFNIGYNRAVRIMNQLESYGIVGPMINSSREVYFKNQVELDSFLEGLDFNKTAGALEGYIVGDLLLKWDEINRLINEKKERDALKEMEKKRKEFIKAQLEIQKSIKAENAKDTDSSCFIATVVLETETHPILTDLRYFRDMWLLQRNWGIKFVRWYYKTGPKAAKILVKSPFLRMTVLFILIKPLHFITKKMK